MIISEQQRIEEIIAEAKSFYLYNELKNVYQKIRQRPIMSGFSMNY